MNLLIIIIMVLNLLIANGAFTFSKTYRGLLPRRPVPPPPPPKKIIIIMANNGYIKINNQRTKQLLLYYWL